MKAHSMLVTALLAVAATLTLFAFVIGIQPQRQIQIGLTAQAGDVQNMIESEQAAEQQNEAAQQQMQLDEQLASQ